MEVEKLARESSTTAEIVEAKVAQKTASCQTGVLGTSVACHAALAPLLGRAASPKLRLLVALPVRISQRHTPAARVMFVQLTAFGATGPTGKVALQAVEKLHRGGSELRKSAGNQLHWRSSGGIAL